MHLVKIYFKYKSKRFLVEFQRVLSFFLSAGGQSENCHYERSEACLRRARNDSGGISKC